MCELSSMIITLRVSLVASCQNPDINWYCIEDIVNLQCTFICLLIHNNNVLKCPQREFISRDKCVPTLYINQPTHCWPLYISKQPFCQFLISVDRQPPVLIFFFSLTNWHFFFLPLLTIINSSQNSKKVLWVQFQLQVLVTYLKYFKSRKSGDDDGETKKFDSNFILETIRKSAQKIKRKKKCVYLRFWNCLGFLGGLFFWHM